MERPENRMINEGDNFLISGRRRERDKSAKKRVWCKSFHISRGGNYVFKGVVSPFLFSAIKFLIISPGHCQRPKSRAHVDDKEDGDVTRKKAVFLSPLLSLSPLCLPSGDK